MANETILTTPEDLQWLRETHLKYCKSLPVFVVAVIVGNEDFPDSIHLYKEDSVTSQKIVLEPNCDDEFQFVGA